MKLKKLNSLIDLGKLGIICLLMLIGSTEYTSVSLIFLGIMLLVAGAMEFSLLWLRNYYYAERQHYLRELERALIKVERDRDQDDLAA